jgi:hypothetical protein
MRRRYRRGADGRVINRGSMGKGSHSSGTEEEDLCAERTSRLAHPRVIAFSLSQNKQVVLAPFSPLPPV